MLLVVVQVDAVGEGELMSAGEGFDSELEVRLEELLVEVVLLVLEEEVGVDVYHA